ncbi:MAG: hypothetical protein K1X92_04755 [Bacteroidia bacterium]|nr:hypothetical protein [Bacteroidia bacterium]
MKRNIQFGVALLAGIVTYAALSFGGAPRFRHHHEVKNHESHGRFFHNRCSGFSENPHREHCKRFQQKPGSGHQTQ